MISNPGKSGIMRFGTRKKDNNKVQIKGYPIVNQYKYLGEMMEDDLDSNCHPKAPRYNEM